MTHQNRSGRCARMLNAASALAVATAFGAAAHAEDAAVAFHIEAQPLAHALMAYGEQSDTTIVVASALTRGKSAPAVNGDMTPDEALTRLLEGSGLSYARTDDGRTTIAQVEETGEEEETEADPQRGARRVSTAEAPTRASDDFRNRLETDRIVITGTNIRGIAPDSSPVITFDREDIDASGFQSTELFIRSLPQNAGGSVDSRSLNAPSLGNDAYTNNVAGNSVNLRGLGAGATLTLLNGRRLASSGSQGGFTDISVIPLSAVERVEVMTDGASAIYGADAIAGVVNFVLRDDFDGAESQLSYGSVTEGDMDQYRFTQLLGSSWNDGNVLFSYEFFDVDELTPDGKDFARGAPDLFTLLPGAQRHSAFLAVNQRVSGAVELSLDAFYTQKEAYSIINLGGEGDPALEYAPDIDQFSIAPAVEIDLSPSWQLRANASYGETEAFNALSRLDDPSADLDDEQNSSSIASVFAVADGTLFSLPGGDVKAALGGEARRETFSFVDGPALTEGDRDVYAAFVEALVPIVSEANARPGLERLELSLAARYDDYSDFGDSFNPKVGVLWTPVQTIDLRASYGTSFNPPTLGEINSPTAQVLIANLADPAAPGGASAVLALLGARSDLEPEEGETISAGFDFEDQVGRGALSVSASYYDITFNELISTIPLPPGGYFALRTYPDFFPPKIVTENPDQARVDQALAAARSSFGIFDLAGLVAADGSVDASAIDFFYDTRVANLAFAQTQGLDFSVLYESESSVGAWAVGLNANYILEFERQAAETTPPVDLVDTTYYPADLTLRGSVSLSRGAWNVASFVNYTDSYTDNRESGDVDVDSYTTFDLNVRFDAGEAFDAPAMQGLQASVGVINAFNEEPPYVFNNRFTGSGATAANYDPANADPRGRFIHVELRKRW